MKMMHVVSFLLTVVGALNWGLIGLLGEQYNLVHMLLGSMPSVERLVYVLVGASAVWLVVKHKEDCKLCK